MAMSGMYRSKFAELHWSGNGDVSILQLWLLKWKAKAVLKGGNT